MKEKGSVKNSMSAPSYEIKNKGREKSGRKMWWQKNKKAVRLVSAGDKVTCLGSDTIPTAVISASRGGRANGGGRLRKIKANSYCPVVSRPLAKRMKLHVYSHGLVKNEHRMLNFLPITCPPAWQKSPHALPLHFSAIKFFCQKKGKASFA